MRSSLSNPASPSTLNFQGVTVSLILAERAESVPLAAVMQVFIEEVQDSHRHATGVGGIA